MKNPPMSVPDNPPANPRQAARRWSRIGTGAERAKVFGELGAQSDYQRTK